MLTNLLKAICGTISILSLVLYDVITLCRILDKEEYVKKGYAKLMKKEYNEEIFFALIRPCILQLSFMTFLISMEAFDGVILIIHYILLIAAPILAFLNLIKNAKK